MGTITFINPLANTAKALRDLADKIDRGEIDMKECTLISPPHLYHFGQVTDVIAAREAVFNLTFGLAEIMSYGLGLKRVEDE